MKEGEVEDALKRSQVQLRIHIAIPLVWFTPTWPNIKTCDQVDQQHPGQSCDPMSSFHRSLFCSLSEQALSWWQPAPLCLWTRRRNQITDVLVPSSKKPRWCSFWPYPYLPPDTNTVPLFPATKVALETFRQVYSSKEDNLRLPSYQPITLSLITCRTSNPSSTRLGK